MLPFAPHTKTDQGGEHEEEEDKADDGHPDFHYHHLLLLLSPKIHHLPLLFLTRLKLPFFFLFFCVAQLKENK